MSLNTSQQNTLDPQDLKEHKRSSLVYHTEEMLWANQQLYPNSATYQVAFVYKVNGEFVPEAFEKAMNQFAQRHTNFRSLFMGNKGRAQRVEFESVPISIEKVSLENEQQIKETYKKECAKPIFLNKGPLWRVIQLNVQNGDNYLLFIIHHIIFDEQSIEYFSDELFTLYQYELGIGNKPQAASFQFTDYIEKKAALTNQAQLDKEEEFWKYKMKEVMPFVELPFYRCPNDERRFRGGKKATPLNTQTLSALRKFLKDHEEYSLNTVLLSCFKALLYRYFGNTDIASVSPIDDREELGFPKLIGFVGNILPLHTHLDENLTFRSLVESIQKGQEDVSEHSYTPLNNIVQMLRSWDGRVTEAPFQVMYEFREKPKTYQISEKTTFSPIAIDNEMAKLPLTFTVYHDAHEVVCEWEINKHVFDELTIQEISDSFPKLVERLCTQPDQKLGNVHLDVPSRTPGKNIELPAGKSYLGFPKEDIETSIVALFHRSVQQNAKKLCAVSSGKAFSYNQLNTMTDHIAKALLAKAPSAEPKRYALYFEHDVTILPGVFGVLKSGNAYIPLDTHSPKDRLVQILEDASATAILISSSSESTFKEVFGEFDQIPVYTIESLDEEGKNIALSLPEVKADDIAYILYTSGSTGNPKGVVQNHRNVLHHMRNWTNSLKIGSDDRLTLFSSFAWDSAVQDMFGALLNGATLYPLDLRTRDLKTLASWLEEKGITVLHATVPLFRKFAKSMSKEKAAKLSKLRAMALGGDAMHKGDIEMYKSLFPDTCYLLNMYGATESSSALYYVMDHHTELEGEIVPIGYPADETEIMILKNGVEQRAHSIVGEIGIKSKHVAAAYWNNAELEQKYFTQDRQDPTKRVYMTGDLGRVLENGAIEYVARKDFQIKIRGFRVGLGELESFIAGHEAIKDVIVIAREDLGEEKELVAYYVPKPTFQINPEDLRNYLLNKVPDYMIPRFIMELGTLPLTIRGKIDREALPVPEKVIRNVSNISIEKPRDLVEEKLVDIWQETLKVSPIGIRDNFFSLGGHSLLGFEMFEKVEEVFKITVEPVALYRGAATIELLANTIRNRLN